MSWRDWRRRIRHSCRSEPSSRLPLPRLPRASLEAIGAPFDLPRPAGRVGRQHRHRRLAGRRTQHRRTPQERRPRAATGPRAKAAGTYRFFEPDMDAHMQARRKLQLDLRKALANGEFELYYQPHRQPRAQRDQRHGGPAALAPSRARQRLAGGVHAARGGDRPDRADRRVGAAAGLRRCGRLARARQGRRQPVGRAVQEPQPGRDGVLRARCVGPAGAIGWSWRSPSRSCCRTTRRRSPRCTSCARSACASRSTISAPATPRSATCAASPSTRSRSTAASSPTSPTQRGCACHPARGRESRRQPRHRHDRGRRGDQGAAGAGAPGRLHGDAGLLLQPAAAHR